MDKYILEGHKAVLCTDPLKWADWFEKADRAVGRTTVKTKTMGFRRVCTSFLSLDHNYFGGPPVLFETMVFPCNEDGRIIEYEELDMDRCSTWEEAEVMHQRTVDKWKEK